MKEIFKKGKEVQIILSTFDLRLSNTSKLVMKVWLQNIMEKITFIPDTQEEPVEFYVLEETRIGGVDYILVTDSEEGDAECLILKDLSEAEDAEAIYAIVEDENELDSVFGVFEQMLEDVDIER